MERKVIRFWGPAYIQAEMTWRHCRQSDTAADTVHPSIARNIDL